MCNPFPYKHHVNIISKILQNEQRIVHIPQGVGGLLQLSEVKLVLLMSRDQLREGTGGKAGVTGWVA